MASPLNWSRHCIDCGHPEPMCICTADDWEQMRMADQFKEKDRLALVADHEIRSLGRKYEDAPHLLAWEDDARAYD